MKYQDLKPLENSYARVELRKKGAATIGCWINAVTPLAAKGQYWLIYSMDGNGPGSEPRTYMTRINRVASARQISEPSLLASAFVLGVVGNGRRSQ